MRQLDRRSVVVWQLENALGAASLAVVLVVTSLSPLPSRWQQAVSVLVVAALLFALVEALLLIPRRFRYYRYAVTDGCIIVEQGNLWKRRHVYPLSRVLYCQTRQGPLLGRFDLYAVHAGTIVDSRSIGPVSKADAEQVERAIRARAS